MYRITGEKRYQDIAWQMFVNIDRQCRTKISYAAISDVSVDHGPKVDSSESFWMAETLKYLYLIFSEPELVSLDEWVFNTEAHPLRKPRA
jgi:mannosyl-oligosaccharide alpha-1,2-mannosidase